MKVQIEIEYNQGDIYKMSRDVQKQLIKQYCSIMVIEKAKSQTFPTPWEYLLERADSHIMFDPLTDL